MSEKVTMQDVAKYAGVSSATVCRALQNFSSISPNTRKLVLDAARELNYIPSQKKQPHPGSKLIGVVIGDIRNPYFGELIYHMQNEFLQYGFIVTPFSIEYDPEKEQKLLETIKHQDLAGLVMISSMDTQTLKHELAEFNCPITLTDRLVEGFYGNICIQDNFQAGYLATKHLIDLGYKQIAFLASTSGSASSTSRVEGYRAALKQALLPVNESWILPGELSIQRGYQDGLKYIEQLDTMPRAVIAANDLTAIGFMEACREKHVRIPVDVSLVSFDDIQYAGLKAFNITSVKFSVKELAHSVCELTVQAIAHPELKQENRVLFDPKLIVRGTTCKNSHE